jgi:hypothetical protein
VVEVRAVPRSPEDLRVGSLPPNALPALRGLDDSRAVALPSVAPDVALGFDPVGVYRCGEAQLVLDAAGRFRGCGLHAGTGGAYRVEGGAVTLEGRSGVLRLQLADDGMLVDSDGMHCTLGGEP